MAKYYGAIGYSVTTETAPGVWSESVVERKYKGDILRNTRRWENNNGMNDDLNINNSLSIVADAFAYDNYFAIKYATILKARWKVTNVEIQRPRLILTIGGLYNET